MKKTLFWIFGTLQSLSLGIIIFLIFRLLNNISGLNGIGLDSNIVLSIGFPLFLLLTEFVIYSEKLKN
ncbi:MAG: hypothetical protein JW965_09145 [Bacteroidales bacterium]|nr:hypothetical protein [Bacteroidales bacterium]